jgi:hypothetical protein
MAMRSERAMKSSTKSSLSDTAKHLAKHGPGWLLAAIFIERMPDILRELGPACKGAACFAAVVAGGGALTWAARVAGYLP